MPEFLQPTRRSDLFDLLQLARERAEREGEPLEKRFCVISYGLDLASKDGPKAQADYARIWGYSRSWVCRHIGEIAAEAEAQRTFYRADREVDTGKNDTQQSDNIAATRSQQPRNSDPLAEPTDGEKDQSAQQPRNDAATAAQQGDNTNRSHYSDYKKKGGGGGSAPAREEGFGFLSKRDEVHRPEIEAAAARTGDLGDPDWLTWLAKEKWPRPPADAYLDSRSEKYTPAVLAAGLVIAAADKDDPHTAYLESILQRLHAQQERTRNGRSPNAPERDPARDGSDFEGKRGWWPSDDWGRSGARA